MRLEAPGVDGHLLGARDVDEALVEGARLLGRCRRAERRPAAATAVAVERELGHDQHRAADVGERAIHLPGVVVEDAQADDFAAEAVGVGGLVTGGDAEEHAQSLADGADDVAVDRHLRFADALYHGSHRAGLSTIAEEGREAGGKWRLGNASARMPRPSRMIPDNLHIGPVPIHIFGLLLAAAFLAAGQVAGREFARKGYDPEIASSALVWAAGGSLVGARLWLVVEDWPAFVRDPIGLLFTGSGFVFYGGLVGGALAVTWVFRRNGVPWWRGADAVAPAIVLGQAIGRIGCQLSGDGDWGTVTTVPWGMAYPHAVVGWPYPPGVVVHPTPVYESLAYFAIFAWLWRVRRDPAPDGTQFCRYLVLAPLARFLVEFVRINSVVAFGLTAAQVTSLVLIGFGALRLVQLQRQWRPAAA